LLRFIYVSIVMRENYGVKENKWRKIVLSNNLVFCINNNLIILFMFSIILLLKIGLQTNHILAVYFVN